LAEQLIRRAKSYVLVGYKLYRWGASSGVLMKCVPREEGKGILEIHKGVCGNHCVFTHAGQQGLPTSLTLAHSSG
jgi:hypothetical protein